MNKEDLIFDYFEGNLPEQYHDELFEQLHYDEYLRKEFYSQMKIRELVREDANRIKAPLEATNYIFNAIGVNPNVYRVNKFGHFFNNMFKKLNYQKIAIIGLLILLTFSTLIIATNYDAIIYHSPNQNTLKLVASNQKPYPIISSTTIDNNQQIDANNTTSFYNQNNSSIFSNYAQYFLLVNQIESSIQRSYNSKLNKLAKEFQSKQNDYLATINELKRNNDNGASDRQNQNNLEGLEQFDNKNISSAKPQIEQHVNNNLFNSSHNTIYSNLIPSAENFDISTLLKGILPSLYNYEFSFNSSTSQISTPNNATIGKQISYSFDLGAKKIINRNHKVGLNIGRDFYPQSFSRNIDGKSYTQVQSPQLYYLGLSYQYIPSYFLAQSYVLPVFSAFAGGTSVGPLMKFQLGTEFSFLERFSLNFGVENTTLFYNVENKIYSTNKVNFVYGINFKL